MAKRPSKDSAPAAPAVARTTMLDDIIGQAAAKRILHSAIKSGRVHHAWIFHGPVGIGKFTTAYAFAAAMLDSTTGAGLTGQIAPDPASEVQRLCKTGNHPDLHVISKELAALSRNKTVRDGKQTTIAKAVLEEFFLEPALKTRVLTGQSPMGKVFIVDEAEMLDAVGQNFLLKLLEEPPPGTAIILVTSNEDRLLATIRSRCQRVQFHPLDETEMEAWFKAAAVDLDARKKTWLRAFAAGSPGIARLAIDADLFQWQETLGPLLTLVDKGQFSPELGSTMAKLIGERAEADVKANPDASKDGANKVWGRRMLAFIADHYRAKLRAAAPGAAKDPDDPATQRWLIALDAVNAAEGHLALNVNLGLLLENLAAQLAREPELV